MEHLLSNAVDSSLERIRILLIWPMGYSFFALRDLRKRRANAVEYTTSNQNPTTTAVSADERGMDLS
jgi:hypothetical protein